MSFREHEHLRREASLRGIVSVGTVLVALTTAAAVITSPVVMREQTAG